MTRTTDEIANLFSVWILGENDTWRKASYILAHSSGWKSHRAYLLGLLEGADTPGAKALKERLSDRDMAVLRSDNHLSYNVWVAVGINVCVTVGAELSEGERERLQLLLGSPDLTGEES